MSYSVNIPEPLPADGYRKLSPQELARRAAAMQCIHEQGVGHCQGQVYTTLFFDGTGNNPEWVEPKTTGNQQARNKHSNIARLFNARLEDRENGIFADCIRPRCSSSRSACSARTTPSSRSEKHSCSACSARC